MPITSLRTPCLSAHFATLLSFPDDDVVAAAVDGVLEQLEAQVGGELGRVVVEVGAVLEDRRGADSKRRIRDSNGEFVRIFEVTTTLFNERV